MAKSINLSCENNCFPDDLKLGKVSPVFTKNDNLNKENHSPVSVDNFMKDTLRSIGCFRRNHCIQHCLMCMLQMCKDPFDKGCYVCAILMDFERH